MFKIALKLGEVRKGREDEPSTQWIRRTVRNEES